MLRKELVDGLHVHFLYPTSCLSLSPPSPHLHSPSLSPSPPILHPPSTLPLTLTSHAILHPSSTLPLFSHHRTISPLPPHPPILLPPLPLTPLIPLYTSPPSYSPPHLSLTLTYSTMTVDTRRNVPCSLDNRSDLSLKVKKIKRQKQCRGGCVEVGESL